MVKYNIGDPWGDCAAKQTQRRTFATSLGRGWRERKPLRSGQCFSQPQHSWRWEQHKQFWHHESKLRAFKMVPERISATAVFICTPKTHLGMLEGWWKCCTGKWRNKNIPKGPDHQPDEGGNSSEVDCVDPAEPPHAGLGLVKLLVLEAEAFSLTSAQSLCSTLDHVGSHIEAVFPRKSHGENRNGKHLWESCKSLKWQQSCL